MKLVKVQVLFSVLPLTSLFEDTGTWVVNNAIKYIVVVQTVFNENTLCEEKKRGKDCGVLPWVVNNLSNQVSSNSTTVGEDRPNKIAGQFKMQEVSIE